MKKGIIAFMLIGSSIVIGFHVVNLMVKSIKSMGLPREEWLVLTEPVFLMIMCQIILIVLIFSCIKILQWVKR